VKKGARIGVAAAAVVVAAGILLFAFRGRIFPAADPRDPAPSVAAVTRGDITLSVTTSGQFQPNTMVTIRPDSNMPTRKIVKIFVTEGARVKEGQALAEIDPTGLDLTLKSAEANLKAQKVKLENLKGKPTDLDVKAAEADLSTALAAAESAQSTYDNTKALADKGLSSRNQLADAERQLAAARAREQSSRLALESARTQSVEDQVASQEAALTTADSDRQMARIVLDSTIIRSPMAGVVAEVLVNVGDLVSPSSSIATVVDPDPMWLQAQVNETDMANVKPGETAEVTPSSYPDWKIAGKVTQIDLHASVVNNVSVFTATIEVPNKDGKLLWGMNADAEISVLSLKDVLTLPSSAIHTSGGTPQVTIMDEGRQVSWDIQTGASDGSRTEIVAGLDEGQEVVAAVRKASTGASARRQNNPGLPFMPGMR
jgi:HlyD family secretion protein